MCFFNKNLVVDTKNIFNYNDELPEKFVNLLMKHGKKAKAYILLRKALSSLYVKNFPVNTQIEKSKNLESKPYLQSQNFALSKIKNSENAKKMDLEKVNKNLHLFTNKNISKFLFAKKLLLCAIQNVQPSVQVRKVKVAGKNYQVPSIIPKKRQQLLAIRWIIDCAKQRKKNSNLPFYESLSEELFHALKKSGKARQKRDELHKLAESNRAYTRFKWW